MNRCALDRRVGAAAAIDLDRRGRGPCSSRTSPVQFWGVRPSGRPRSASSESAGRDRHRLGPRAIAAIAGRPCGGRRAWAAMPTPITRPPGRCRRRLQSPGSGHGSVPHGSGLGSRRVVRASAGVSAGPDPHRAAPGDLAVLLEDADVVSSSGRAAASSSSVQEKRDLGGAGLGRVDVDEILDDVDPGDRPGADGADVERDRARRRRTRRPSGARRSGRRAGCCRWRRSSAACGRRRGSPRGTAPRPGRSRS